MRAMRPLVIVEFDDHAMGQAGDIELAGILRRAGDLGAAVDAGGRTFRCKVSWRSPAFLAGLRPAASLAPPASSVRTMARRARSILKALCPKPLASRSSTSAALREGGPVGGLPAQRGFGLRIAPGLVRDAAEREARLLDRVRRRAPAPPRPRPARTRRTAGRGSSGSCSSRRSPAAGSSIAVMISSGCEIGVALRRRRRAADGNPRTRWCARPPGRSRGPWRRAPRARRTCRTDAWRCRLRWCRGSR